MLATFNLQLVPLGASDDAGATLSTVPLSADSIAPKFTDLLRLRVDSSLADEQPSGDFLPTGGNSLPQTQQPMRLPAAVLPQAQIQKQIRGAYDVQDTVDTQGASEIPAKSPNLTPDTWYVASSPTTRLVLPSPVQTASDAAFVQPATTPRLDVAPAPTGVAQEGLQRVPVTGMPETPVAERVQTRDLTVRTAFASSNGAVLADDRGEIGPGSEVSPRSGVDAAVRPRPSPTTPTTPTTPIAVMPPDAKGQWFGLPSQSPDTMDTISREIIVQQSRMQPAADTTIATTSVDKAIERPQAIRQPVNVTQVMAQQPVEASRARERLRVPAVSPVEHAMQPVSAPSSPRTAGELPTIPLIQSSSTPISTPVLHPDWGDRISERVLTMANGQLRTAEIRLTPAELGPIRIQVSVEEGAANVTFHAQHSITREAIEQALPRLREMLTENGLSLGQASVGEQGSTPGNREHGADKTSLRASAGDTDTDTDSADEQLPLRQKVVAANSLVDTFA